MSYLIVSVLLFLNVSHFSIAGWCVLGKLPERVRARSGDTVRGICRSGRRVLVLRCGKLLRRHRTNAGQETVTVLAHLLEVHQSDIFVRKYHRMCGEFRYLTKNHVSFSAF